ncbi:MAG: glycan-binding surface protein [Paludibacteraceae bacterium]|nr:glycan-binding surface protein [Paludibacteraceae bacterium]
MRKVSLFIASLLCAGLMSSCNGNQGEDNNKKGCCLVPKLTSMKCEFVPDGGEAIIYGKNLTGAEITFPGDLVAEIVAQNDTMVKVIVPEGTKEGRIKVKSANGHSLSKFFFRDGRNIIVNFDKYLATWGGYSPMEEDGTLITGTLEMGDSITPFPNNAKLPEPCSGNYGFLYGKYSNAWSMNQSVWIQYVANPVEGGRGPISVAGKVFEKYDLEELALRFEVYVPQEVAYKGIRTEIFFGPINAADKHGRDYSPIYFWKPYENTSDGFYTDAWTTVTIPLTEFCHNTSSDEPVAGYDYKNSLKQATNFSFLLFGQPEGEPQIFMCVDNFRIVPVEK